MKLNEMYNRIESLCKDKGISVTQMCREADIKRANLTELKMGRTVSLSAKTLDKISEYFGVSADFIMGREEQKKPAPKVSGTGEDVNATELLIQFCQKMGWLGENGDITADQADALISIIDLLEIIFKSKK